MTLFSKNNCKKCDYIKDLIVKLGLTEQITIEEINADDDISIRSEILAHMAFHEAVALAEISMPILVDDDSNVYTGGIVIKNRLAGMI
jgi:hypothetical protein